MEDPDARSRRVWDQVAPRYDRSMRPLERLMFGGGREWVCARATGSVLEVSVGTGLNLPHYPAGVRLVGIDLSRAMLGLAADRAKRLDIEVRLSQASAHQLPFRAGVFDTVVCTLSLCAIPDHEGAIREMARVLRPGGRLLLLDHVVSTVAPLRGLQRFVERFTVRTAGEHFTRHPRPLLAGAGFQVTEAIRRKAGTVERVAAVKRP